MQKLFRLTLLSNTLRISETSSSEDASCCSKYASEYVSEVKI